MLPFHIVKAFLVSLISSSVGGDDAICLGKGSVAMTCPCGVQVRVH